MNTVSAPPISNPAIGASGSSLTLIIDRWIYVFMASWFIAITLIGFIPDSLAKIALVEAGQRPPFPLALHIHSVLMGSFLLLLLTQTFLVATGRTANHQRLGIAGAVLAAALVIAGFVLVPTMYNQVWGAMQSAPPEIQAGIAQGLREFDNIMLLQIQVGILFSLFIAIALMARKTDSSLHKRMMFLAIAIALPAAFDRMTWLPTTLPANPLSPYLYILLAVSPMFLWDLARTRAIHRSYLIWLAFMVPSALLVFSLWDTDWWHAMAPRLVGLG
jgi:hypothetical protein